MVLVVVRVDGRRRLIVALFGRQRLDYLFGRQAPKTLFGSQKVDILEGDIMLKIF